MLSAGVVSVTPKLFLRISRPIAKSTCSRFMVTETSSRALSATTLMQSTDARMSDQMEFHSFISNDLVENRNAMFRRLRKEQKTGVNNSTQDFVLEVDMEAVKALASQKPTSLRLEDMYKYGTGVDMEQRIRNACFLHKELPIRVAQRAMDLLTLPYGLSDIPAIQEIASVYISDLQQFQDCPMPSTPEKEAVFTHMLTGMLVDGSTIPAAINRGMAEWLNEKQYEDLEVLESKKKEMNQAFNRFFTGRMGLRLLTEHHILSNPALSPEDLAALRQRQSLYKVDANYRGCIQADFDPAKECRRVADEIIRRMIDLYGESPEIEIVECDNRKAPGVFTFVPHHFQFMLGELLLNSCRATVKRYQSGNAEEILPVRIVLVKGAEDITVKVADNAGGIPRSKMDRIFKFSYTTCDEGDTLEKHCQVDAGSRIRGFGMPLARIYARYFGGELTLRSMEGSGLDAYLYLPQLGNACEELPPRVVFSPGNLDSTPSERKLPKKKYGASKESKICQIRPATKPHESFGSQEGHRVIRLMHTTT